MSDSLLHESLTRSVIGAFYEVYNVLGHGFLEGLYVMALERELRARGHRVSRELSVRVMYKGEELGMQRLDMVVDDLIVVEVKSTHALHDSASRQLLSYLHVTNLKVGLLLHFGPRAQFRRVVCERNARPRKGPSMESATSAESAESALHID